MAIDMQRIRDANPVILCIGSHPATIQSMLDFEYLAGRSKPSICAIIATGRKSERYFFGGREVMVPVYDSVAAIPATKREQLNLFLCLVSGRRVLAAVQEVAAALPNLIGGTVFAERIPEQHALELSQLADRQELCIIGGASVGLLVANELKLGAIGGTEAVQLVASKLFTPGQIAVVSTSGGMVNEIIRLVAGSGFGLSFALAVGGERYPITTPRQVLLAAEADEATKAIAYFGELGGGDEYEIIELIETGQLTKPVVAYVAGVVAELFETPPQFGHAKAMAGSERESAMAKRQALAAAGVQVANSFTDFIDYVQQLPLTEVQSDMKDVSELQSRRPGLITSSVSYDEDGDIKVLGQDLLEFAETASFARMVAAMLLGKPEISPELERFVDFVLRLLVDHGPYVSGAVNTIVTARAGRDLVSSLAAGLLTVGPRFGGAINEAANIWLAGVREGLAPAVVVESYASQKKYILGIGHRKYRMDFPDPRVANILSLTEDLEQRPFTTFALGVEAETTQKKGNLILNVDGAIAAGLLDVLYACEGYDLDQLQALVDIEFFNALFVLSRSVGFMAHYFDQKRIDEGLFRLADDQVTHLEA